MGRTNLNPHFWGPSVWRTIHAFAVGFPDEPTKDEVDAIVKFFDSLNYLIPCESCREHYKQNYKMLPPMPVYSKKDLVKWTFDLHNVVNRMLKKKEYSYEDFESEYELQKNHKNENFKNSKKIFKTFAIILASIIILVFLFKNSSKK
jgi:hypothetical protein